MGHLTRTCWAPEGGIDRTTGTRDKTGTTERNILGVDSTRIRNSPHVGYPWERIFLDGSVVKWCGLCGSWIDHYCVGHPVDNIDRDEEDRHVATGEMDYWDGGDDVTTPGTFA